jgi:Kef-type K+ transport system membrane component KefB
MNNLHLAVQFFLQLAVILHFCRLVGAIAVRFGQAQVVAEMLAGVRAETPHPRLGSPGDSLKSYIVKSEDQSATPIQRFNDSTI